jgi:hypothetical protein
VTIGTNEQEPDSAIVGIRGAIITNEPSPVDTGNTTAANSVSLTIGDNERPTRPVDTGTTGVDF